MAEETNQAFPNTTASGKPQPSEKVTTHSKKAQAVAIGLVVLLITGLALQSFLQMRARNQQVSQQKDQVVAPIASHKSDFRQQAAEAERAIDQKRREADEAADAARNQIDARQQAAESVTGPDGTKNLAARGHAGDRAASATSSTQEQVEQRWLLDERRRALDSQRSAIGRGAVRGNSDNGNVAAAQRGSSAPAPQPLSPAVLAAANSNPQVAAQLAKIQATQARLAQIKNQIAAYAAEHGVQPGGVSASPPTLVSRAGMQGQPVARPSSVREDVVGEPGFTRATRTPADPGPAPDERVLPVGSVLSGTLDTDLISDYDGNWRALIARDVYDPTMDYILIPQGSRVVGKTIRVSKVNEVIQNRMGLIVKWIVRPDGKRIDFSRAGGTDQAGVGAIPGDVNYHLMAQLGGVTAYAILGLGPSFETQSGAPQSSQDIALKDLTGGFRTRGRDFANKYLNVVPTITVPAGTPMKIFAEDDIYVRPWARVDDTIYPTALAH